jgi:hypothetical protein
LLLFNKIGQKGRKGSAWKRRGWGREKRSGGHREEMTQAMYAHMNKKKIIRK